MTSPPSKISLYDLSALKSTTDDALAPLLTSLPGQYKFTQSHYLTNVRLALGYVAVTIAGVLFYADWKLGWNATKAYTLPACVVYFILNSALTLWIWKVEAGKVFVGTRADGYTISLASSTRKFDPTYNLTITQSTSTAAGATQSSSTISTPFNDLFNIHGFLDRAALKQWLAANLDAVGKADPVAKQAWEDRNKVEEAEVEIISAGAARNLGASIPKQRKSHKG